MYIALDSSIKPLNTIRIMKNIAILALAGAALVVASCSQQQQQQTTTTAPAPVVTVKGK